MPINDNKNRFRSAPRFNNDRFIHDIRPRDRSFPTVGATLSSYRGSTAAQNPLVPAATLPQPLIPETTKKRRRRIFTKKRLALLIIILVLIVVGWVGGKFIINTIKVFHGNVFGLLTTTKLKGEDTGRVNILLAGNSADDPGHDGADLTDSIMIVSIDTKNNTAFMLSVPRDLWVDVPGYGYSKINAAYVDGQTGNFSAPGYPNGGMGLLEEVVDKDFGINIDYYALINYAAFRDAVNAVGGIDVNIQSSDPRGLYDPSIDYTTHGPLVKLSNGMQHLDGEQALDLARARGDDYRSYGFPDSDFDRTEHQRQMLLAIKSKAMSIGVLANPIKLGNLFDSIGNNVHTDLSLGDARRLYQITQPISNSNIKSESLNSANGANLLANYTSSDGESALIPAAGVNDYGPIQLFIQRLTTNNPVLKENASVVVLNGTDTYGLAAKVSKSLTAKDINVASIGDANGPASVTTIIDNSSGKKPATLKLLKSLYGDNVTTINPYSSTFTADFILVVGNSQTPTGT